LFVDTGNPKGWLDHDEPLNTAKAVEIMKLKYVVLTSVNRDDFLMVVQSILQIQ
jgi:lipoic acid synthetase